MIWNSAEHMLENAIYVTEKDFKIHDFFYNLNGVLQIVCLFSARIFYSRIRLRRVQKNP